MDEGFSPVPVPEAGMSSEEVLMVSQLNRAVATVLESAFPLYWVRGEVSNFTAAASGHWYFTVKDERAAVRAVMFRGRAAQVGFQPRVGDRVEVRARVSLYEPRGDFQLQVQGMRRAGVGSLYEAFLRLKEKLAAEGLLDGERKRPIPRLPQAIGIITSLRAAALRDVLTCLARRAPQVPIFVYPAAVQGAEAPGQLLAALQQANAHAAAEVLLMVRGGGSIEDLWAFNDEALARAVAASPIPVVSGVGHESDFTIVDLVADVRAPTPTAAAEIACVARQELLAALQGQVRALCRAQERRLDRLLQRLDRAAMALVSPGQRVQRQAEQLQQLRARLLRAQAVRLDRARRQLETIGLDRVSPLRRLGQQQHQLETLRHRLQRGLESLQRERQVSLKALDQRLQALGPQQTLARGYAIVRNDEGRVLRDASQLQAGSTLRLDLAHGAAAVVVQATRSE